MIRGIRSSVCRPFLLFLKADWEILFHMQTEGGRLSKKLKLGSWSCLYRAEETFFTAVAFPPDAILTILINQSCYTIHNSRFHTDYKPDCKPVCVLGPLSVVGVSSPPRYRLSPLSEMSLS